MMLGLPPCWVVREGDFPRPGPPGDKLLFLVQYALLAPSIYNTQPWLYKLRRDLLLLSPDRSRSLPAADPHGRLMTMSCGASLEMMRIAANHFAYGLKIDLFPSTLDPQALASICLDGPRAIDPKDEMLFRSIMDRRTFHGNFAKSAPENKVPRFLKALNATATENGILMKVVKDGDQRAAIASLVARSNRMEWRDRFCRREMASWIRTNFEKAEHGIPAYAFGIPDGLSPFIPSLVKYTSWGLSHLRGNKTLALDAPYLCVLGTTRNDTASWVSVGSALAKMMLIAQKTGLKIGFLNGAIATPRLQGRLKRLLDLAGFPQLVLRVGCGPDRPPTNRIPHTTITKVEC